MDRHRTFECPLCEQDFSTNEYLQQDVWYEPCNDGSYNAYVTLFCPHCQDTVSVAV